MAYSVSRPSAVTLAADPKSSLTMDFDAMVAVSLLSLVLYFADG
jgi:hypothetical protein